MKLEELEFNESIIIIESLKKLLNSFKENIKYIEESGKASGYVSWDDPEEDKEEILREIEALKRVLLLYGYVEEN